MNQLNKWVSVTHWLHSLRRPHGIVNCPLDAYLWILEIVWVNLRIAGKLWVLWFRTCYHFHRLPTIYYRSMHIWIQLQSLVLFLHELVFRTNRLSELINDSLLKRAVYFVPEWICVVNDLVEQMIQWLIHSWRILNFWINQLSEWFNYSFINSHKFRSWMNLHFWMNQLSEWFSD